ncbi:RIP metalloprotease RseP [Corynebacterium appendicis CIP 107643]|uniref:Zinc metalloprotease Rip1 n=1 Tax=Corynebacterium appendicis CIP 107643 TaxID=1161099 RepID=A0A1N7J2B9_9CORY|nr:M50 family metallopeptidase [Corynebacterium appendicis]WJY61388.1 Zinc metalloprotease Rip1 [Corynebacterium appendicis CIP 107643]SIS43439.1 RIP metalloprotease RseP [Corynebacterium appendicis CIP 107643]
MPAFVFGIVLFALCIALSIALHEAGHMLTAKAFGMRVRRFFLGFGPTVASVKRGETEYGIAALPFGGFCDIAGMTAMDPLTPEEEPRAMYRKPWWQRVAVMSGGIVMNLLLGFMVIYLLAVSSGIPNPYADRTPTVGELTCTSDQVDETSLADCTGDGPAAAAGVRTGDRILTVDGEELASFVELRDYVMERPGETIVLGIERRSGGAGSAGVGAEGDAGAADADAEDSTRLDIPVQLDEVVRLDAEGQPFTAGAVGMGNAPVADAMKRFGPLEAGPAAGRLSGEMITASVKGLIAFPGKIPGVVSAIFGGERDVEGPISVVGASRAGGELVEQNQWAVFFSLLASLNFFLALFNLVPLPPLDGGHIAVVLYEAVRDRIRRLRGLPPGEPVNYEKLMPLTYSMAALLLGVGVLVMIADVTNPVRLFG